MKQFYFDLRRMCWRRKSWCWQQVYWEHYLLAAAIVGAVAIIISMLADKV